MSSPTFDTWKRMIRDGQRNAVSNERLVCLVESGLWDVVVDAPDYQALTAALKSETVASAPASKPEPKWRVGEDGVIYLKVTSNGVTGEEWISRLEAKGYHVGDYAKSVLRSDNFEPTNGVTTEVAVLKGILWNDDTSRTTRNIRAEAKKRKFRKLSAEVACLIREQFTDEELAAIGPWYIAVMHAPIEDFGGVPRLLRACCFDDGQWLDACCDEPGSTWVRDSGFAFAVPAK